MTAHPYHAKLARILARMGGLYSVSDILGAIAAGHMQSFTEGDSWAITKVCSVSARSHARDHVRPRRL